MITTLSKGGHAAEVDALLAGLGVARQRYMGGTLTAPSPISGEVVAAVQEIDPNIARNTIDDAHSAFLSWRNVPAPRRGELIRLLGEELRTHKDALGRLVSIEVGKIVSAGRGRFRR